MVAFLGSRPRTSAGPRSRTAFSSACVSVTSIRVVKLRQVDPRPDWLAPRRRCIRCSHSLGGICSGGWGMQDASSAWRACRSRHRGGDRAAFVKPPGLTPRGTATRTAGVASMPTNFLEHQRAPGERCSRPWGDAGGGLLRATPMRHWMARHAAARWRAPGSTNVSLKLRCKICRGGCPGSEGLRSRGWVGHTFALSCAKR